MKKLYTTIVIAFLSSNTFAQAPDMNMEAWANVPLSSTVQDPLGWTSFNIGTSAPINMAQTVFKETVSPYAGLASAKIVTQAVPASLIIANPFRPGHNWDTLGILGMGGISIGSGITQTFGKPINTRPTNIKFACKYSPVGNDSASVVVFLTHWTGTSRDTVARGKYITGTSSSSYSIQNITLNYSSLVVPDTQYVYAFSSVYNHSGAKVGSTFYIDSYGWEGCTINNPVVNLGNDTSLCVGTPLTLNAANAGDTYLWSTTQTSQNISINTSGTYYVVVTEICSVTDTIHVTFDAPPTPTIMANGSTTFCQGDSVTLSAPTSTSYLWTGGSTAQSLTVFNSTGITLTVFDALGCSSSSSTSVIVNPLPSTPNIFNVNGVLNSTSANGYQWNFGTVAVTGAISQTFTPAQTGLYTVTITDANGCSNTSLPFSITSLVGITELSNNNLLSLYPNPTSGQFTIVLSTDNATIIVTDILGQQVLQTQTTQNTTNLQLDNNGIYIVYVKTKQGTTTRKLTVNR